jgi:hypothetical protein
VGTGRLSRLDTRGTFDDRSSWATIDLLTLPRGRGAHIGGVFDGRYVYLVPFGSGVVTRLDPQGPFTSADSYRFADLGSFAPGAEGYVGGGFDGRYLYLSPFRRSGQTVHGLAARFDTRADFEAREGWTFFDLTGVHPELRGLTGVTFDGTYLYYTPYNEATGHHVARYDPRLPFTENSAWVTFDVALVDAKCKAFQGGVFDGRYLYYVPGALGVGSMLARYDTTAAFAAPTSWSTFDLANVDPRAAGFIGGHFDGRFLYLSPYGARNSGLVFRHDTTRGLNDRTGWSTFDLLTIHPSAKAFAGWGFDGRYLYLAPDGFGRFARFDAKSPPSLPPFTPTFM